MFIIYFGEKDRVAEKEGARNPTEAPHPQCRARRGTGTHEPEPKSRVIHLTSRATQAPQAKFNCKPTYNGKS